VVLPGELHLIILRAQRGQQAFADPLDRARYLNDLRAAARDARVAVHAYALLDDEVRLLVTPSTHAALGAMMQGVGRRYVRAFNQRHGRTGTPWEGRFRSTVVESARHFLDCVRFVEGRLGPDPGSGSDSALWSSLRHHLGLVADPLISEHPSFWALGNTPFEREAAYRRHAEQPIPAPEVATILRAASHGWALGTAEFAKMVHQRSGRRAVPMPGGRPRKSTGAV
jgi:putative transposase